MLDMADIQTPLQIRAEAEQMIGHELIKSLISFKQNAVAPLTPSILYNTSSKKEEVVVRRVVQAAKRKYCLTSQAYQDGLGFANKEMDRR
jgi:hypothetical protein